MSAYYNENDKFNVEWLKHLIAKNLIAPGEVDGRNIQDVRAEDLRGFTQCHFFAGIGVWSYALRSAGWPDEKRIWTGSCPCQPFSVSGKRAGASDERHLWPEFFRLIAIEKPVTVFGEQVASDDGLAWLDLVSSDMEGQGYTIGAVDTPACGFGAPHRRQRLYWVADADRMRCGRESSAHEILRPAVFGDGPSCRDAGAVCTESILADSERDGRWADITRRGSEGREVDGRHSETVWLADSNGRHKSNGELQRSREHRLLAEGSGVEQLAIAGHERAPRWTDQGSEQDIAEDCTRPSNQLRGSGGTNGNVGESSESGLAQREHDRPGSRKDIRASAGKSAQSGSEALNGFWGNADWLWCRDEKYRPVEPGTFPLANGVTNRVGKLRGYGNALVAPQAEAFIRAYMEIAR